MSNQGPLVLLYDLEIAPLLGWAYEVYEANIIRVERNAYVMCFAWQWLGDERIQVYMTFIVAQVDEREAPRSYRRKKRRAEGAAIAGSPESLIYFLSQGIQFSENIPTCHDNYLLSFLNFHTQ